MSLRADPQEKAHRKTYRSKSSSGSCCIEDSIPCELALVSQTDHEKNVVLVTCTRRLEKVNESITGAATELVCFRLAAPDALRIVGKLGAERDRVEKLPLGSFIGYNRLSGASLGRGLF